MKIAIFHQPIGTMSLQEQSDLTEIVTNEVARRLAQSCDAIMYAKKGRYQKEFEYHQGVQYRRLSITGVLNISKNQSDLIDYLPLFGGESLVVEVEKVNMIVETACNEYFGGINY